MSFNNNQNYAVYGNHQLDGDDFDDMMSTDDLGYLGGNPLRDYARSEHIELLRERPNLNNWGSLYGASHDLCKYIRAI